MFLLNPGTNCFAVAVLIVNIFDVTVKEIWFMIYLLKCREKESLKATQIPAAIAQRCFWQRAGWSVTCNITLVSIPTSVTSVGKDLTIRTTTRNTWELMKVKVILASIAERCLKHWKQKDTTNQNILEATDFSVAYVVKDTTKKDNLWSIRKYMIRKRMAPALDWVSHSNTMELLTPTRYKTAKIGTIEHTPRDDGKIKLDQLFN